MSSGSGNKRTFLTLPERVLVIEESRKNVSQRTLADRFKCGKTQIQSILKAQSSIMEEWSNSESQWNGDEAMSLRKRARRLTYDFIDKQLYKWFQEARVKGRPIGGVMLKEKALQLAEQCGAEDFKSSNGWMDSFKKRHGIVFRAASGEPVDSGDTTVDSWKQSLPHIVQAYKPCDIYSMHETGLFFRALPDKGLLAKQEACAGGKMGKERLTIVFCSSATGDKLPALVVLTSPKPRCLENVRVETLGIQVVSQRNAWMTSEIFLDWLNGLNSKMASKDRNVLLVLDNAPCHPDVKLSNVTLLFLPPNITSKGQPLDQGIIQEFKLEYRKRMLRWLYSQMDVGSSTSELCKRISVLDACRWIHQSWESVSVPTIQKGFYLCDFLVDEPVSNYDVPVEDEVNLLAQVVGIKKPHYNEDLQVYARQCGAEQCSSEEEDEDTESDAEEVQPMPVTEAMSAIAGLKALINNISDDGELCKCMADLIRFEKSLQDLIIQNRQKKVKTDSQ